MAQTLRVDIVGDASGYSRALRAAGQATSGFGSTLGRMTKIAALATGGAGLAGIAIVLRQGQKEWTEHAKVAAQTAQVLKTTGSAAGVTQKQVEDLATAMMRKTGIDDEAIQSSENLLLSFTRVRNEAGKGNDIFNRATKVIQDYSVRTGKSATQATMLFGKALQEVAIGKIPTSIRGLGKLSDAQVKQMKAMVAAGDVAGAQGVILKMLEERYGGAAEAAGNTLPGKINILKESFRNFSAELFKSVVPALTQLVDWTTAHMPQIEVVFRATFTAIGAAIRFGADVIRAIIPVVQSVVAWFQQNWPEIERITMRVFNAIAPVVVSAFNTIKSVIMGAVTVIQGVWQRFGTQITTIVTTAFNFIKTTVQNVLNVIRGIVNVFGGLIHGDWSRVWLGLQQIFGAVASQIEAAVRAFGTLVVQALTIAGKAMLEAVSGPWNALKNLAVSVFNSVVSTIRGAIGSAIANAKAVGEGILKGVSDGITGLVKMVQGWFQSLWAWLKGAAQSAYAFALNIGKEIIHGIEQGFLGLVKGLGAKLKDAVTGVLKQLDPRRLNPFSPVSHWAFLLAAELGRNINRLPAILGPQLSRALTSALTSSAPAVVKGMGTVGQMIVAAAKKYGVDARAALAVAMTEGGVKFGAVGDSGHAFGPFQLNNAGGVVSGMDAGKAAAFANSLQGITFALKSMAAAGAAGKAGFAAIEAIVRGFERPANPEAEIQKALEFYKRLPGEAASAIKAGAPTIAAAHTNVMTSVTNAVALYVGRAGSIIGLKNAQAIALGVIQGKPGVTAAVIKTMTESATAAAQAAGQSFASLADRALAAFDAKVAAWKAPQQRLIDKMQLQDQIKGIGDALNEASATAEGGGAALARTLQESVGGKVETAMSTALSAIAGAKTTAALNQVSQTAQTQMTQAITNATAAATTAAQTAVDQATAALQAAQAGGDPDAIAAAQQALDTAVANQNALNEAVRGAIETGTGILIQAETTRHEQIAATQRTGLEKQLTELGTYLAKHPEAWNRMGGEVQKILTGYNVKLQAIGVDWVVKFAAGVRSKINEAVAAAKELGAAVKSALDSALAGSPEYFTYYAGQEFVHAFDRGMKKAQTPTFTPNLAMAGMGSAGGFGGGGPSGGDFHVTLVMDSRVVAEATYPNLVRMAGRNVNLRLN